MIFVFQFIDTTQEVHSALGGVWCGTILGCTKEGRSTTRDLPFVCEFQICTITHRAQWCCSAVFRTCHCCTFCLTHVLAGYAGMSWCILQTKVLRANGITYNKFTQISGTRNSSLPLAKISQVRVHVRGAVSLPLLGSRKNASPCWMLQMIFFVYFSPQVPWFHTVAETKSFEEAEGNR